MRKVKAIEVHPDKVVIVQLDGIKFEYPVRDVRRLVTCPSELLPPHSVILRGGIMFMAEELKFRGTVWVEVEEKGTGCIRYERPQFEAAAKLLEEAARRLKEASELLSRAEVQQLVAFYEQHRGCSEEYTWVKNPAGVKYYYWYLKCPNKPVSSIYLGPEGSPRIEWYRRVKGAARAVAKAVEVLREGRPQRLLYAAELLEEAARALRGEVEQPKEAAASNQPQQPQPT